MSGILKMAVVINLLKVIQVQYRLMIWIGCIYMLLMGGCVSKAQFDTVSNDYLIAQKHQGELQRALEESKKEIDQCRAENKQLTRQIVPLNQTIKQQKTVISLQKTVIRLFDDGDQTLQTSIQDQVSSQNLQTTE